MEWFVGSVGNNPSAHTSATGIKWFGTFQLPRVIIHESVQLALFVIAEQKFE